MARRLDRFTQPFVQSRIPFLLTEVLTDGRGEMTDLVCRFANAAAGTLLGLPPEELTGARFTRRFPGRSLSPLAPLAEVAFSGSAASFPYVTLLGRQITITCYQPAYGMAAVILDSPGEADPSLLAERLPAAACVLELSRDGLKCLFFNQQLCRLTGWSRRELLDLSGGDFARLAAAEDWPDLLQALLDAARDQRSLAHEFRLLRREGAPLWVDLRAEHIHSRENRSTFYALLLDIDRRRRDRQLLTQATAQLTSSQARLSALFQNLPGGFCLLRQSPDGVLQPLEISRGLSALLNLSPAALRRLAGDPLRRVLPADREPLAAAIARAHAMDVPLRHVCRLRPKGGGTVWIQLDAIRQPEPDGGALIYAACQDITGSKELEAELMFQRQLTQLLERTAVVLLDYDPESDTARIHRRDSDGRDGVHVVRNYLATAQEDTPIHPEDRRRLAAGVRRAAAHPAVETLEYRADYDGRGWRSYRVTWLRQIDSQGNVTRLLGKAEDITAANAAAERFQQLCAAQRRTAPDVLAVVRLDLTDDRIQNAQATGYLKQVLFGNTADACLRHLSANVPDPAQQARFSACFSRQALLDSLQRGQSELRLEHRFTAEGGLAPWAETCVQLLPDPDSGHAVAFCAIRSIQDRRCALPMIQALSGSWAAVLTVDAATGVCRLWSGGAPLPSGMTYRALAAGRGRTHTPSSGRTAVRRAARLETVLAHLETAETYRLEMPADSAALLSGRTLCWQWLDRTGGTLLLTISGPPLDGIF